VTAMMRLDTNPVTPGLRARRVQAEGIPVLIQVPRVDEPCGRRRGRVWRPEEADRGCPAWRGSSRSTSGRTPRAGGRPRRRLRRGVRQACWSLLVLASMASTFTMGWTTRGGGYTGMPLLSASTFGRDSGDRSPSFPAGEGPADDPTTDAGAAALEPDPSAPVADVDVPVVLPGYVLPDDSREEPAHEGS